MTENGETIVPGELQGKIFRIVDRDERLRGEQHGEHGDEHDPLLPAGGLVSATRDRKLCASSVPYGYEGRVYKVERPKFGSEEAGVYGEALDALDRAGIRYMLGGALALNAYTGIWRDTKDLDVFVPREALDEVLGALRGAGFETEVTDPCWLAKAWQGDLFVDVVHANHNGFASVEESWFANAKEVEVLGRRGLVIPAEEMLLSKVFVASRDRYDLSDVLHLIFATRGDLDWGRIVSGLDEHWELLLAYLHLYRYVYPSHARYVPRRVLGSLRERYEKEAVPEGPLRFRGTLLDEVSFAVDVEAWGLPDERAALRKAQRWGGERE